MRSGPRASLTTVSLKTVSLKTVSLRRRVTVWVLLLLVLMMTSLGLVVNLLLGDALRADLQQRLQDKAGYAAILQEQGVTGQTLADRLAGGGVFSSFTSGEQRYVGREQQPPGPPGGRGAGPRPRPAIEPTVSYTETNGRLVAAVNLRDGVLSLSTDESYIFNTLSSLRRIELLAGGLTLVVAGALLFTVVRAALRPLERMSGLARRVRDGARGSRLRPTKPRTDLGSTAQAFDDMLDALESAEAQARSAELQMRQFLADASHDLRTPLAGVIAGSEQLLRTPAGRAEREERLVQVIRQARRASRLVDDLLLMTRLDTPGETTIRTPQPIDPVVLIAREIHLLRLRRPDLSVEIAGGPTTLVLADPDQLQRAQGNLLENAAAATPNGGVISIRRSITDGVLSMRIVDSGPGVPPEDRERIFDRFVRLSSSRTGDGSGLGLPISRAIVRADGGDLRCLPSPSGACFEIRLPVFATPTEAKPAPVAGPAAIDRPTAPLPEQIRRPQLIP